MINNKNLICKDCGTLLSDAPESKIHVVLGGKGAALCETCALLTDDVTLTITELREMLSPWDMQINGIDVPWSDCPEPDFAELLSDDGHPRSTWDDVV